MLIPLGFLAATGGASPQAMELISTTTLTSNATSVSLTNLETYAGTYQHLQLRMVIKGTASSTDRLRMLVNGSDANLRRHGLQSINNGSVVSYSAPPDGGSLVFTDRLDSVHFSPIVVDILDPYETKNKTMRAFTGGINPTASERLIEFVSIGYFSTSVISSMTFGAGNTSTGSALATGSRISLYGIKG